MDNYTIEEIRKLFAGDSYTTDPSHLPPSAKKNITGKLSFMKTLSFYRKFLKVITDARKLAVKGEYTPEQLIISSFRVLKDIENTGCRFEIRGLDNLRKEEGAVVIAANHMSTLETAIFPCVVGVVKDATFVVKKSLITNPVFGPVMRSLDPIDVERKEPRKDLDAVLGKGSELLGKGRSVILFPQATRSPVFEPDKFNSLGIKLAKRASVKIVPAALKTDFWENGKIMSTCGYLYPERTVHVEFAPAIEIDGAGKKEQEQIVSFIASRIESWK